MKAYKGFDKNLKCKWFQYEIGKEYEEKEAILCRKGFHACENPMEVFGYYPPSDSRYCEVELDATEEKENDSKRCGKKIQIGSEIGISGIIKEGVKYILDKAEFENNLSTNTGDQSAATNTGYQSAATNTGNWSAAEVSGKDSIAIVTGYCGKAKGSKGCWIVLTEREESDDQYRIKCVKAFKVDDEDIMPDTFYTLKNGKAVKDD